MPEWPFEAAFPSCYGVDESGCCIGKPRRDQEEAERTWLDQLACLVRNVCLVIKLLISRMLQTDIHHFPLWFLVSCSLDPEKLPTFSTTGSRKTGSLTSVCPLGLYYKRDRYLSTWKLEWLPDWTRYAISEQSWEIYSVLVINNYQAIIDRFLIDFSFRSLLSSAIVSVCCFNSLLGKCEERKSDFPFKRPRRMILQTAWWKLLWRVFESVYLPSQ